MKSYAFLLLKLSIWRLSSNQLRFLGKFYTIWWLLISHIKRHNISLSQTLSESDLKTYLSFRFLFSLFCDVFLVWLPSVITDYPDYRLQELRRLIETLSTMVSFWPFTPIQNIFIFLHTMQHIASNPFIHIAGGVELYMLLATFGMNLASGWTPFIIPSIRFVGDSIMRPKT